MLPLYTRVPSGSHESAEWKGSASPCPFCFNRATRSEFERVLSGRPFQEQRIWKTQVVGSFRSGMLSTAEIVRIGTIIRSTEFVDTCGFAETYLQ
jgi:hypothetical protein